MSTNLRLSPELALALRRRAQETGRSQQEIVRGALAKELGLASGLTDLERAIQSGLVRQPTPFRDVVAAERLPDGVTTLDLLDRDER